MKDIGTSQLKRVIESQHGGASSFLKSVRVHRGAGEQAGWDGLVHIFDLKNHASANRVFAWSSHIAGTASPRFFAVLQTPRTATPVQAVKAASAAIRKWGPKGTR